MCLRTFGGGRPGRLLRDFVIERGFWQVGKQDEGEKPFVCRNLGEVLTVAQAGPLLPIEVLSLNKVRQC
jgi:hypothetical protein